MKNYTAFEYLCIDVANQIDLDKETFETRIEWVKDNFSVLELIGDTRLDSGVKWKEYPLYVKAVAALREACEGKEIGHMVGADSTCSGMQIMSALTGCEVGALHTNLIDPDKRYDAYTVCTDFMSAEEASVAKVYARRDVKDAVNNSWQH